MFGRNTKYLVRDTKGKFRKPQYLELHVRENGVLMQVQLNKENGKSSRTIVYSDMDQLAAEIKKFVE